MLLLFRKAIVVLFMKLLFGDFSHLRMKDLLVYFADCIDFIRVCFYCIMLSKEVKCKCIVVCLKK